MKRDKFKNRSKINCFIQLSKRSKEKSIKIDEIFHLLIKLFFKKNNYFIIINIIFNYNNV